LKIFSKLAGGIIKEYFIFFKNPNFYLYGRSRVKKKKNWLKPLYVFKNEFLFILIQILTPNSRTDLRRKNPETNFKLQKDYKGERREEKWKEKRGKTRGTQGQKIQTILMAAKKPSGFSLHKAPKCCPPEERKFWITI
jgi:hypothetical protein